MNQLPLRNDRSPLVGPAPESLDRPSPIGEAAHGRSGAERSAVYAFGPFRLCAAERRLERAGQSVALGDRAFDVLVALVSRAGAVVDKRDLLDQVWPNLHVDEGALRVSIAALREELGDGRDGARYVINVRGRGYCFVAPVEAVSPAAPAGKVIPARSAARAFGLPAKPRRVVGREPALAEISQRLSAQRFVTVVGPGGMGKTTVALALCHDLLEAGETPVCFADLGGLSDPALTPNLIANILGLQIQGDPTMGLLGYFRERRMLLVLDSCEHVIGAAASLAEQIVLFAPMVSVLATSREPLRVEGEHVYRLPSLAIPDDEKGLTAVQALEFASVQLLVERAAAAQHRFALTDDEAEIAVEICRRLDGIALALEIAGGRAGEIGLRETAAQLDSQLSLRWMGRRTAVPRHQTLKAALDWGYSLLSEDERRVLRRLAVFVGPFSMDAACSVASDAAVDPFQVADAIANLVSKSLIAIVRSGAETRYRLLDITRAYVHDKLEESGEEPAFLRRLAGYLAEEVGEALSENLPFLEQKDLALVRSQLGNIRSVLPWCFSPDGDGALGAALTAAVAPALIELTLWSECERWTAEALAAEDRGQPASRRLLELLTSRGQTLLLVDRHDDTVRALLVEAGELAAAMDEPFYQFRALIGLHRYLSRNEDYAACLAAAEEMIRIAERTGAAEMAVLADLALGIAHHFQGDQQSACRHMIDGLERMPSVRGKNSILFGHHSDFHAAVCLARTLWLLGFPEQASAEARRVAEVAEQMKEAGTLGVSATWTIQVYFWTGDWPAAEDLINRRPDLPEVTPPPLRNLGLALKGELLVRTGDPAAGLPLLRHYLDLLRASGAYSLMPTLAYVEGQIARGSLDDASTTLSEAIAAAERRTHLMYMPEMMRLRGEIVGGEDPDAAEACFDQAGDLARRQSALSWELRAALSQARLHLRRNRPDRALAALRPVYERFTEGFASRDLRAAGALIDQIVGADASGG